jgi:hypothetical protein
LKHLALAGPDRSYGEEGRAEGAGATGVLPCGIRELSIRQIARCEDGHVSGKPTSMLSPCQKGEPFLARLGGSTGEKLLRAIPLALLVSESGSQKRSRVLS